MAAFNDDDGSSPTDSWTRRRFEVQRLIHHSLCFMDSSRFELRLRYFPQSIEALSHDKPTFGYFYEQVNGRSLTLNCTQLFLFVLASNRLHAFEI